MKRIWITVALIVLCLFLSHPVYAADSLEEKIRQYEGKITELRGQENSLSKQISLLDNDIKLSELRIENIGVAIDKLEKEIGELVGEIGRLEVLLTQRLELVLHRIPASYKRQVTPSFGVLLFSTDVSDFISRIRYMERVQRDDAESLFQLKTTQNKFGESKDLREKKKQKQEELKKQQEAQKKKLDQQKYTKQTLLEQTKNSESVYQNLLAQARNELAAIQGIISGGGTEVEVRQVSKGDAIASVIQGGSCNSSGTHLHFMVTKVVGEGYSPLNPFGYLNSVAFENCSALQCNSPNQDPFNPSGSWDWPLDPMIILNQGYGRTWAVSNTWVGQIYSFHDGIDITGSSLSVKAVQEGTLYRGFYTVGCKLQYVKVKHKDSDMATFYLHVNYN